jgi:hypothetical protein
MCVCVCVKCGGVVGWSIACLLVDGCSVSLSQGDGQEEIVAGVKNEVTFTCVCPSGCQRSCIKRS